MLRATSIGTTSLMKKTMADTASIVTSMKRRRRRMNRLHADIPDPASGRGPGHRAGAG